jgi:GNAT superfamily N-acetyltransferase
VNIGFAVVPPADALDPALRQQLLDVWVAATDAGGSVGFTPPAPVDEVAAALDVALAAAASGEEVLGVVRTDDDRAVGMGFLVPRGGALGAHWRTVLRVMVHPSVQGTGAGRLLMEGLHDVARSLGLEHLHLSVRGGEGLEGFYERFGYRVVGTHPGAVRVGPTDTRDEIFLVAEL